MKIIIVGWLYLINPIITAKEYLTILGYDVYFLPLLYYNQHFTRDKLYNPLISFIKNIDPNIILWWNWEAPANVLKKIKENTLNILHCLFNWDHPFCLSEWDNKQNRKITQKNIWDLSFVTGDCKLQDYIDSGSNEAYYLRMFVDDKVHFPEVDKEYDCDVSLVCTQLYNNNTQFPDTLISREQLLKDLIKENIKVKIYGSEHLKEIFPNNYHGFVHFLDNHKVFTNSKINICTHVTDGHKYCNERVGTILSSGGLLLCDKVNGIEEILTDGKDCILIDEKNYIEQIKDILKNYDDYKHIKKNAVKTAKEKFSPKFWAEFIDKKIKKYIKNNPINGLNLKPIYSFENYQKNKISIVMTYFNRITQLLHTLDTIEDSKYPMDLIEVICYDDRSDIEPLIIDSSKYSFNLKIIYGEYERDKKIINSTHSYNLAFKYITGEYVIIQNSECMHIGDIISYAYENLKYINNKLISFPCWATANEEISKELVDNRFNSNEVKKIVDSKWSLLDFPKELKGWYNHKTLRPECLHFCNAMHINTFKKIGLFNTKLVSLLGFDDNDFGQRIMFNKNIDLEIPDHNYNLFVVHQYHGKYNKPRPYDLFLKSYDKYRKISNYNKNNFLKNIVDFKDNNVININYKDIKEENFINKLDTVWSYCFVYLKSNSDDINIDFLRKCLKHSNFRILY